MLDGKIQVFEVWAGAEIIGSEELVSEALRGIVDRIGMMRQGDVNIQRYDTPDLGFTAKLSIASFDAIQHLHESYVVYDNWIELRPAYANIVLNSCKRFDTDLVIASIKEFFNPVEINFREAIFYDGNISA